eukprot:SAG31_NODE_38136_length_298_cov_1.562814_1_plen_97_part_01
MAGPILPEPKEKKPRPGEYIYKPRYQTIYQKNLTIQSGKQVEVFWMKSDGPKRKLPELKYARIKWRASQCIHYEDGDTIIHLAEDFKDIVMNYTCI